MSISPWESQSWTKHPAKREACSDAWIQPLQAGRPLIRAAQSGRQVLFLACLADSTESSGVAERQRREEGAASQ